ncbi:MAG: GMC oxidoreductase [Candidatus Nanopelagicaceae bacterium]
MAANKLESKTDYDVIVIGSGFGGSVAALRLAEKGYRVCVIEAGARFEDKDFPKTSWRLRKFLYAPRVGLNGIQRIHKLPDVFVLCGAGVGGGSLVYANTLYQPGDEYFQDPQWRDITDWKSELEPWYQLARRMLGVVTNPFFSNSDHAMKKVAEEMGVGDTFKLAPLGIYFGDQPDVRHPDPYFGGDGPERKSCINCGECMTGCRHNAKNTLVKNYLYFAEKLGVEIKDSTTVTEIFQHEGRWKVKTKSSKSWLPITKELSANEVIVAAGTYNTQKLLHRMKSNGNLNLPSALGSLSRTNSESLVGTIMPSTKIDFSEGAAITSSFFPNSNTHVEPVRYGKGSNSMGLLQTIMTSSDNWKVRVRQWFGAAVKNPTLLFKILNVRKWSERTVIALVMQNVQSAITVFEKRSLFGTKLSSKNDAATPNPTWIPEANEVAERVARNYNGIAGGNIGNLIGSPFTAHFVGGCVIGKDAKSGVIDPYHRVWGYPTLHIVDGSTITANLGVNPSLTITAQAERALSFWPNKGGVDPRPTQSEPYKVLQAISPNIMMRR